MQTEIESPDTDPSESIRVDLSGIPRPPTQLSDTPARLPKYWAEELSAKQRRDIDNAITGSGGDPTFEERARFIEAMQADEDFVPTDIAF